MVFKSSATVSREEGNTQTDFMLREDRLERQSRSPITSIDVIFAFFCGDCHAWPSAWPHPSDWSHQLLCRRVANEQAASEACGQIGETCETEYRVLCHTSYFRIGMLDIDPSPIGPLGRSYTKVTGSSGTLLNLR